MQWLAAFFSGGMILLALPPFDLNSLAWFAFVPVLIALHRCPSRTQAVFLSVQTALIALGGIFYSVWFFSKIFTLGGWLGLSLLFGAVGLLYHRAYRNLYPTLWTPWLAPSLWVLIEYLLTSPTVALPINFAVAGTAYPRLIQVASVTGIFGVSFILTAGSASLAYGYDLIREKRWRPLAVHTVILGFLSLLIFLYGGTRLHRVGDRQKALSFAALQPRVPSEIYRYRWLRPEIRQGLTNHLDRLSQTALSQPVDLLIWPEGGNGYFNLRIPSLREKIQRLGQKGRADILLSSADLDQEFRRFNSIFSISAEGRLLGRYDKNYLTPIGESQFTAGTGGKLLPTRYGPFGAMICFESCFPTYARHLANEGAQFLFVSSSDAPFRRSVLPLLHARVAQFRAIETGRFLIRAANTGPSFAVDPAGRITTHLNFYEEGVLMGAVEPRNERTPYMRFGDWLVVVSLVWVGGGLYPLRKVPPPALSAGRAPWRGVVWQTAGACGMAVLMAGSSSLAVHYQTRETTGSFASLSENALRSGEPVTAVFEQRKSHTCGLESLAYVMSYLGEEVSSAALEKKVSLTPQGLPMSELARLARETGFTAVGEKRNYRALIDAPKPLIAHIRDDHYVVIVESDRRSVTLFDPARSREGFLRVPAAGFQKFWRGNLLRIGTKEIPKEVSS